MPQPRRQRPSLRAPAVRFQDGGHVPGTGRGDKIPAKYEPGEFVVSNDMIDDNPGLREQLASLRAETLAARGKTVAEADAKAMTSKGLRAVGGFGLDGEWMGGNRAVPSAAPGRNTMDPAARLQSLNAAAANARMQQAAATAAAAPPPPPPPSTAQLHPPVLDAGRLSAAGAAPEPPLQKTLRTTGFSPVERMVKDLTGQGTLPPRSPMGAMANDLGRTAQAPAAAPEPPPTPRPVGPGNPNVPPGGSTAAREYQAARATSGLLDEASAATRAASEAARPGGAPAPGPTPSAAKPGLLARTTGAAGSGLRTAAGFAAKAGNAVGATVGAVQSLRDIGTGYRDHFAQSVGAEDAGPWGAAATDTLRTAANVGNALTGGLAESLGRGVSDYISGGSFREGWKQPTSRDAFEAAQGKPAGQPAAPGQGAAQTADPRDPYAAANAAKIAAAGAQATGAPTPGGYGPIGDRTALTNEQAATMNPQGRVTATRGANGTMEFSGGNVGGQVSYNDADGKALPGGGLRGKGFSNFDVAPAGAGVAMGPGGYAFATSGSGVQGQGSSQSSGPQTLGGVDVSGLSGEQAVKYATEVRNAQQINAGQRALREAASSYGSSSGRIDLRSPEYLAARARKMDAALDYNRMSRSEIQARTALAQIEAQQQTAQMQDRTALRGQDITAGTSRHSADTSFAGTKYSADAQLGGKQMEVQQKLRQQQALGSIYQAAGGDPAKAAQLAANYGLDAKQFTEMAGTEQTRAKANSEDAQSTFKGMFTRSGKDGPERDEHAEAQAHQLASQVVPGWENMNPEQRNANRAKVVNATRAVQGMNSLRNHGWGQAIGWDAPTPEYSQLPDLNGATVGEVGLWDGATTPKVSKGDTKITLRSGEQRHIPAGTLSEAQLRMLQDNGAMRSTR